jgi:hypothetical protein
MTKISEIRFKKKKDDKKKTKILKKEKLKNVILGAEGGHCKFNNKLGRTLQN